MTYNTVEDLITFLREYYSEDVAQLAQRFPQEQKSLYVDYDDLYRFDPEVARELVEHPKQVTNTLDEALRLYDLPAPIDLSGARVRVHNLPSEEVCGVSDASRHENINRLLAVRGQVQKVSGAKPRLVDGTYICQRCGTDVTVAQEGNKRQQPHECAGCERKGPFDLDAGKSTWTDHQFARLQQPPERTRGTDGQTIDIHLEADLIEKFDAGDRIVLTGILDVEEPGNNEYRDFNTVLNGHAVTREESDYDDIDVEEHLDEIAEIADGEHGDPYELLVDSINPPHHGDEEVKLAIALQLFGGWSRSPPGGSRDRGDSHILLLGDPGCGKSTFLHAVDNIAPRSTYASGKGATAAGMTAAAVPDDFGDSEWSLEAGALVLADQGIACVDEIDKVQSDAVSSMHDALESQKVRVNKAGINATLNARTALLAAGNPSEGRFDSYQARAQQIDLAPTLMSRFDLMFMVSDNPDPDQDRAVIDHMRQSRRASAKHAHGEDLTEAERASIEPAIPRDVLRAYIAHAKATCEPILEDPEAERYLREEFMALRLANQDDDDNPVPVTYRQQEAIERLAEASARVRLDDKVRMQDVRRAAELVKESMQQVGIDPETGEYDVDVVETGQSKSQRDRRKQILAILEEKGESDLGELVDITRFDKQIVEDEVESLLDKGRIYQPTEGNLRKA